MRFSTSPYDVLAGTSVPSTAPVDSAALLVLFLLLAAVFVASVVLDSHGHLRLLRRGAATTRVRLTPRERRTARTPRVGEPANLGVRP